MLRVSWKKSPHSLHKSGSQILAIMRRSGDSTGSKRQGVVFHALESRNDGVLWDVQPAFVVMVDSDVAFVRQLEVTHTICRSLP